jgi:DMSO reductase anchor subunit
LTFLLHIYLILLMAVGCFTAPVMIYLLFASAKGVAFLTKKRNGLLKQITEISQSAISPTEMDRLVQMDKSFKKKIDLLNTRRQLPAMYLPLLSAIGIGMLYVWVKDRLWVVPTDIAGYLLMIFSIAAFLDAIHRIYLVTVAAVETQRQLEADQG